MKPASKSTSLPAGSDVQRLMTQLGVSVDRVGVVIVDHGSRRAESNELLLEVAEAFRQLTGWTIVEPAHMELAEPSVADAFDRAVEHGAQLIIVHPYFLAPGRHWRQDIPALAADAAARHPAVRYLVTAPLGLHPLMLQIMNDRIVHCLQHAMGQQEKCDVCAAEQGCTWLPSPIEG